MLLFLITLALQDDPSAAALEEFKTAYKAKDVPGRVSAVTSLAATQHDKVYAKLGQLLGMDDKDVRIAAAKGLSGCTAEKKAKAVQYLLVGAQINLKEPATLAAILEALGKLKHEGALPEVEKHFRSKDTTLSQAAIKAAVEIKSSRSVPGLVALLKWLEDLAKEAPNYSGGGGAGGNIPGVGGGGVVDQEARDRERILTPIVNKALQTITGESLSGRKDWEDWYRQTGGRAK